MSQKYYVIVVVDDNKDINELLTELLEDRGYTVASCFSGEEAYLLTKRLNPDLVITDVSMEVEDAGFRLLERIRAEPTTAHIGVIVCSASAPMLESRRSLAKALNAHLVRKPFDFELLCRTIRQLLAA